MKLNGTQLRSVEKQLGLEAISEQHPVAPQLKEIFGDHSFFVDVAGLNIVQSDPSSETSVGSIVKVASWNEDKTGLEPHEPQVLPLSVDLQSEDPDLAG